MMFLLSGEKYDDKSTLWKFVSSRRLGIFALAATTQSLAGFMPSSEANGRSQVRDGIVIFWG